MFKINENSIEMIKGDTAIFRVDIEGRKMAETDKIVFTVKDAAGSEVIKKEAGADATIIIDSAETISLAADTYFFDVAIVGEADVITLFKPRYFVLREGVSINGNN